MTQSSHKVSRAWLASLALLLLVTSLGCSLGRTLVGDPTPSPTPAPPTLLPTWTPLPAAQLSPAEIATLTVLAALAWPTLTPTTTPIPTETPTPTIPPVPTVTPQPDTPTPGPPTPTATATPFISVASQLVNVRAGPSIAYSILGQVRQNETYALVGRNEPSTWWLICCVDDRQVWITSLYAIPQGPSGSVAVAPAPDPPPVAPTVAPTGTPPPTNTPAPWIPFDIGDGPQFFASTNAWLTIWIKAFTGASPNFGPVSGYRLRVLRNGADVSKPDLTDSIFQLSAPFIADDPYAYGNRREYNLKYEYLPQAGDAQWTVYLTNPGGIRVSPEVTFETTSTGLLREVYVGFYLRQ